VSDVYASRIGLLRYMVEARSNPAQAALLKPGQPVIVVL